MNEYYVENNLMKYYLIYGLNSDFTYLEEFETYSDLLKHLENFVKKNYKDDYKIIMGVELKD